MKQYVVGYLFNLNMTRVALIHKNRGPADVIGKWNGIGGKIDRTDKCPEDAMRREFIEEAGKVIPVWVKLATCSFKTHTIHAYWSATSKLDEVRTMEDEIVKVHDVADLPNLELTTLVDWLIPLAIWQNSHPSNVTVTYQDGVF